ncbi:hypothetical protein AOQ84DRAFT_385752 [Glonium stellatum]|uniref:Carboxylesterase family protein n=1 Tax=Glonium stellatum TaxID=574774 RepID=A0A8E2JX50_9PEZI|nr:hypothetical protein AOQ84DRAFT_385752 [Glonium stellatum]
MRLTRSVLRAEAIHVDETEVAEASRVPLPQTPVKERAPLGEVAANQPPVAVVPKDNMAVGKKPKSKGGKKPKGKKSKKTEEEIGEGCHEGEPEVLEDGRRAAGSPASDAAVEDLVKENNGDVVQIPMLDERPVSPPSRAVRMTRRQLAKAEEELSKSQGRVLRSKKSVEAQVEKEAQPQEQVTESDEVPQQQQDSIETPAVTVTTDLGEPKSLSSEKPIEEDSSLSRSPSRSPGKTPMRLEESIEAIDALEEAIEEVGKAIPEFDSLEFDDKSPRKKPAVTTAKPNIKSTAAKANSLSNKPCISSSKVSRNPNNLKSLKEGPHTAASSNTPSGPAKPSHSRSASVRTVSSQGTDTKSKALASEVTDYLASKRRPISMSFPTPPPPPKSSKPPTKPTFQLPGEAIAAKLKAQREERQKREEEEAAKKRDFKARPAPIRKTIVPIAVKHTTASKAREGLMHGGNPEPAEKENKTTGPSAAAPLLKRTSSISTTMSGKRQSTIVATSKRASSLLNHPTSTFPSSGGDERNAPAANRERPPFTTSTSSTSNSSKRLSSAAIAQTVKSTVTPADVATQRIKAREIFNRDKVEKEERERQRREKEEAAKKARAEAAERGRIASREWAERQKVKKTLSTVVSAKVEEVETA